MLAVYYAMYFWSCLGVVVPVVVMVMKMVLQDTDLKNPIIGLGWGYTLHIRRERGGREVTREGDREKQKSGQGQGHNSTQLNNITQHNTALEKHNTTQIQT